MYGNVVCGFETLWSICFLQGNTSTLNPMQSKSLKPQNRYTKYGFLNCLCHYAIFCSWFSFFVCTHGGSVNRSTNMLHVAIFIQWFDIYIYTLDIQTPSAKVFGKSRPYKHTPLKLQEVVGCLSRDATQGIEGNYAMARLRLWRSLWRHPGLFRRCFLCCCAAGSRSGSLPDFGTKKSHNNKNTSFALRIHSLERLCDLMGLDNVACNTRF